MCVCVCVCVCVYIYAYIYVCLYIYIIHAYILARNANARLHCTLLQNVHSTSICVICIHLCIYIHIHLYACTSFFGGCARRCLTRRMPSPLHSCTASRCGGARTSLTPRIANTGFLSAVRAFVMPPPLEAETKAQTCFFFTSSPLVLLRPLLLYAAAVVSRCLPRMMDGRFLFSTSSSWP